MDFDFESWVQQRALEVSLAEWLPHPQFAQIPHSGSSPGLSRLSAQVRAVPEAALVVPAEVTKFFQDPPRRPDFRLSASPTVTSDVLECLVSRPVFACTGHLS